VAEVAVVEGVDADGRSLRRRRTSDSSFATTSARSFELGVPDDVGPVVVGPSYA